LSVRVCVVTGALKAMEVAGCCQQSKDRVICEKRKPGALWHIYKAQDSDMIRDLLKKVTFMCAVDLSFTFIQSHSCMSLTQGSPSSLKVLKFSTYKFKALKST